MTNSAKIIHLYNRAGFGIHYNDLEALKKWPIKDVVNKIFKNSKVISENEIEVPNNLKKFQAADTEAKKMILQENKDGVKNLNLSFLEEMSFGEDALRQKMTLFWHGHFACRSRNASFLNSLHSIEKSNALGKLGPFILEVSKSAAMLQFLNNQQNKKGKPNENFARELMELFTIGRGNYTEKDIKESARAFTGWGFDLEGNYIFREKLHDFGQKQFMGRTADLNGDDIINIILNQKQTAYFISEKIFKFFVNENPNPENISEMAEVFFKSDYDISKLMQHVFNASWFYDSKNVGNKIKSPIELLAGLNRQFFINYTIPTAQIQIQRALGQFLFFPPNVSGWAGGRNWIDSTTLMIRLQLPSQLLSNKQIEIVGKPDPEDEAIIAASLQIRADKPQFSNSKPDWEKFFKIMPSYLSNESLAEFFLPEKNVANKISALDYKARIIQLLSLPEYQLC